MTLVLSDDDTTFRHQLRHFFRTEIPADIRQRVADFEEPGRDDLVTAQRILNRNGLAVPHWPTEWGGRDWTPMQLTIWRNELQLAGVPEPLAFNTNMVGPVIAHFGSQEQKERFLPATANLDIWWAQGFSEPDAGSDLASLKTRAVRDGDHYIVTGQKIWTTLAQHADWIFALVRTDPDAKKQKGISFLLIDLTSPGVIVRPIELIDGSCEVNEIFFDEVRVPATGLVGEENAGWDYAKFLLGLERTGVAKVGFSKLKLSQAKVHAAAVPVGAGVLLDDPLFAAKVAELENELLALEIVQAKVALRFRLRPTQSGVLPAQTSRFGAAAGEHGAAHGRGRGRIPARRRRLHPSHTGVGTSGPGLPEPAQIHHLQRLERSPALHHRALDPRTVRQRP